jgi:hypothetical protein
MSNLLTLDLGISGKFGKFELDPQQFSFTAKGSVATGPKSIPVPPGRAVSVALESISEQEILLICATKAVTYQVNGDGIEREINAGGFALHPGDPVVQTLRFSGNRQTESEVTYIRLGKEGTPPLIPSAAPHVLHPYAGVTLGQTVFILPTVPNNPAATLLFIEGVMYSAQGGFFTLVDDTLTWLDVPFVIPANARVEVFFQ